jgi:hypothetical protein
MRIIVPVVLAASLITTNLFAAEVTAPAPLAPGKAAGVQKAQGEDISFWWFVAGAVALGVVIAAVDGSSHTTAAAGVVAATTTTS